MKRLDDKIRAAYQALEESVPDGYFDDFASRVDARLEEQAMNGTEMSDVDADKNRTVPPKLGADDTKKPKATTDTWEDDEHSGLAEITELASKTKKQINRRATTQTEAEDAMLLSASHSGLSAVVLPEPGKDTTKYADADEPVKATKSAAAASAAAAPAAGVEPRTGIPGWVYGAVGIVAAAAVVFFVIRGGGKSDTDEQKVARGDQASSSKRAGAQPAAPATSGSAAPGSSASPTAPATTAAVSDPKKEADKTAEPDGAKAEDDPATAAAKTPDTAKADTAKDDTNDPENARVATNRPARTGAVRSRTQPRARPRPKTVTNKPNNDNSPRKPAPSVARKSKPRKDQSVEDLLGQFDEKKGKKRQVKVAAPVVEKKTLSRKEIITGMRGVASRVQGCYNQHKQAGLVMIQVRVTGGGAVSATATGNFAGTPTGQCVAAAVKLARFPKFSGAPMSFPYPFRLNP